MLVDLFLFEMNNTRKGGSVNRRPILDRTNYGYWKARMYAFLKSIDNKTWKVIINGWSAPTVKDDKCVVVSTK